MGIMVCLLMLHQILGVTVIILGVHKYGGLHFFSVELVVLDL